MGTSKQMTFTLACAVAFSVLIPGAAGYLSGRLEAVESAERQLHAIETRLRSREAREARQAWPVAYPAPCSVQPPEIRQPGPRQPGVRQPGVRQPDVRQPGEAPAPVGRSHDREARPPAVRERDARPPGPHEAQAGPPAPQEQERGARRLSTPGEQREARPPASQTRPQAPLTREGAALGRATGDGGTGAQAHRPATTDPFGWLPQLLDRLRWDR
ncbi:hypothetical protein GCM10010149_43130 [Nonomuraea roseoviolacea subsp. roseoviolacea]